MRFRMGGSWAVVLRWCRRSGMGKNYGRLAATALRRRADASLVQARVDQRDSEMPRIRYTYRLPRRPSSQESVQLKARGVRQISAGGVCLRF